MQTYHKFKRKQNKLKNTYTIGTIARGTSTWFKHIVFITCFEFFITFANSKRIGMVGCHKCELILMIN